MTSRQLRRRLFKGYTTPQWLREIFNEGAFVTELTQLVVRYKTTGKGMEEIHRRASILVYSFPRTRSGLNEDDCGDFLLFFMPKISRVVERYQPTQAAFEHYLKACLRYQILTFLRSRMRTSIKSPIERERAVWEPLIPELAAAERSPSFNASQHGDPSPHGSLPPQPSAPPELPAPIEKQLRRLSDRTLLFFCLKAVCDADEDTIQRMALLCNRSPDWLQHCRTLLSRTIESRRLRHRTLRLRVNKYYVRMHDLHRQIESDIDPVSRSELVAKSVVLRNKYRRCCFKASRIRLRPTNRDIARLLGVPKGSVDSGIHHARETLRKSVLEGRA